MALSKTTQDHDEIRQWAETRGGKPAEVASTSQSGTGILRIEFPGATNANDSNLEEISWDQFFEKFDASGLSLIYQDVTADGEQSNFNKLVYPENLSTSAKKGARKTSAKKTAPAKGASAARKSPRGAAKKTAATKTTPRKAAAVKSTAKKSSGAKSPAKKSVGRPAKKAASTKKSTASTAKKAAPAKKTAARKTVAKGAAKKTATKKSTRAGAQRAAIAVKKKAGAPRKSARR